MRKLGKALFFQIETNSGTLLLLGTLKTLADMLGVRPTFTPEILIRRASKKFNAKCRFLPFSEFNRKVALAQNPDSGFVDVMHFYRPSRKEELD